MTMRTFLLAATAFGLLASPATAREWTKEDLSAGMQKIEYSRYAPSGENRTLEFLYMSRANCALFSDKVVVKAIRKPDHGTVEFEPEENFPTYKDDSKWAKCNEKKLPGVLVKYKSDDDYVGPDIFTILVIFPSGLARELTYKMIVR